MAYPIITWDQANFSWNNNNYTWEDVKLILQAGEEEWPQWNEEKKKKFIKLILKVHGNTITESKQREIKQYKIKARDIRIAVKEILGTQMIAENVSI
tara:strand:+ start:1877 stop:2167 length:291 start_codon:yes stop_codon:yes gene_type:complete